MSTKLVSQITDKSSIYQIIPQSEVDILLKYFPDGVIALDLETTGLSPLINKIIEFSAIKITKERIEIFTTLIDPEIEIPQVTIDIHGIEDEMVKGKPVIEDVLPQFIKFADNLPLLAHNAKFDIGFIVFWMHQFNLKLNESDVFCSIKFSRRTFTDLKSHKLGSLAKELDIKLENHHRALDDAIAGLRVISKGLVKLESDNNIEKIPENLKKANLFNVKDFEKTKDFKVPNKLQIIEEKIETQEIIEIKYKGGSFKNQFRPIRPIGLLPLPDGNFLYAHCLLTDIYKSFALHKISYAKSPSTENMQKYKDLIKKTN